MKQYLDNYNRWINSGILTQEEKNELLAIANDDDEIKLRFSSGLTFGTAGLRGTMKTGMNAMNVYTVAQATQGLANLIHKQGRAKEGVVIAYDCRNNSERFAKVSAEVLAAAEIPTYIFDALRPTPELSFALRELGCVAGINITASHNPKQYNGYKAYWDDGAQLPPEHANTVYEEICNTDIFNGVKRMDFDKAVAFGKVKLLGADMDEKYLQKVKEQIVNPDAVKNVADDLKIVYTPLHGTGHKLVPEILMRIGLKHIYTVEEQFVIDGNFPTVSKPNPEYAEVFELGIGIAEKVGSSLVIATDPDADRVGVMARAKDGKFHTITGNQMGALLLDYIITAYEETNTMPPLPYAVKSVVSTELVTKICKAHDVEMFNVLTGFKFIGEVIKNHEKTGEGSFLFGFEESYGYLKGTYARDKDAVVATMLICEMTAYYYSKGMTLCDALDGLFEKYGFCREFNVELYMEGVDGPQKMAAMLDSYRNNIPTELGGVSVTTFGDYNAETFVDVASGQRTPTGLPKTNMLIFKLENSDVVIIRPSGTEPKVKIYFLVIANDAQEADNRIANYRKSLNV
ncbi:MAG: phospho-sugar mutase [Ruminococcaceae bacterium]|nr:phospho-sugar mutase [Oscillospiraceae bacterium]